MQAICINSCISNQLPWSLQLVSDKQSLCFREDNPKEEDQYQWRQKNFQVV